MKRKIGKPRESKQPRLLDEIKKECKPAEKEPTQSERKMTAGEALRIYFERLQDRSDLKPATKIYHSQRIADLLRSWSGLETADLAKITQADCLNWAARFGPKVSATTFNHAVGILRAIFEIAFEVGVRSDNPAKAINLVRVADRMTPPS